MLLKFNIEQVKKLKEQSDKGGELIPTYEQMVNPLFHIDADFEKEIDTTKLIPSFLLNKHKNVYLTINGKQDVKQVYAEGFNSLINEDWYIQVDALDEDLQDSSDFTKTIDVRFLDIVLENNPSAEFFEIEITKDYFVIITE